MSEEYCPSCTPFHVPDVATVLGMRPPRVSKYCDQHRCAVIRKSGERCRYPAEVRGGKCRYCAQTSRGLLREKGARQIVACPTCQADPGDPCRSKLSGRAPMKGVHAERVSALLVQIYGERCPDCGSGDYGSDGYYCQKHRCHGTWNSSYGAPEGKPCTNKANCVDGGYCRKHCVHHSTPTSKASCLTPGTDPQGTDPRNK